MLIINTSTLSYAGTYTFSVSGAVTNEPTMTDSYGITLIVRKSCTLDSIYTSDSLSNVDYTVGQDPLIMTLPYYNHDDPYCPLT